MKSKDLNDLLTADDITLIKNKINEIYEAKNISNPIIKDDIFRLLESECIVLYYPVEDEDACAFYKQEENENQEIKKFAFINTAMPFDKQIFAAAHELAHILGITEERQEVLKNENIKEYTDHNHRESYETDKVERIANRFAAEFLVPEEILLTELKKICKKKAKIELEHIVELMDVFLVPYKTMVIRLREIGKLSDIKEYENYLNLDARSEKSQVVMLQRELGKCQRNNDITKVKKMPNYVKMALELFDQSAKTYEKLKCQLTTFGFIPEDFNIEQKEESFLSEEELNKLLEES